MRRPLRALFAVAVCAALVVTGGAAALAVVPRPTVVVPATSFPDVPPDAFYTDAVAWAKDNGITSGVGSTGLFQPEAGVTRGQMVTFLERLNDLLAASIAATASQLQGSIAAGVAEARGASLPRGAVVMHTSPLDAIPATNTPATFVRGPSWINVTSSGAVFLPLPGPSSIGGVDYVLDSVEVCSTSSTGAATVSAVSLSGPEPGSADRAQTLAGQVLANLPGCITVASSRPIANPVAEINFGVDPGAEIDLVRVESTWVPADQYTPDPPIQVVPDL